MNAHYGRCIALRGALTEKSKGHKAFVVIMVCEEVVAEIKCDGSLGLTVLTVSLRPGTERLLRLYVSSLGSEPGADRSISERLWSGTSREMESAEEGKEKKSSFKDAVWRLRNQKADSENQKYTVHMGGRHSLCFLLIINDVINATHSDLD